MSLQRKAIAGAIYCALGRPLINKGSDMIGRPLGSYTDEALGATAGYLLRNQKGIVGDIAKVAMITEIASASNQLVAPMISGIIGGQSGGSSSRF